MPSDPASHPASVETTQLSVSDAEAALVDSVVAFEWERDVITVVGPEAAAYLQGQVSQDVEQLAVGDAAWSFVLQPQGKVDGWFRIARRAEETYELDLDAGFGPAVLARLERFKLRTRAEFSLSTLSALAVRGPAALAPDDALPLPLPRADIAGFDLLGADASRMPEVPRGPSRVLEAARIRAGVPSMGRELTEKTIPAEVGVVDQSVSFTKGCYVGQELVARVDSRGNNTPRNLFGVIVPSGVDLTGAELVADGVAIGELTSSIESSELGAIGLAYVKRGADVPGLATVRTAAGDQVEARVESLPF